MKLSHEEVKNKRRLTSSTLESIHHKVITLLEDMKAMANGLMKKYNKPMKIPEKYPQRRFGGNIEQSL